MTVTDRSAEPDAVFAARLETIEARQAVDIAADVAEERAARAIWASVWAGEVSGDTPPIYRQMARAALAAMPPVDERLRERVEAVVEELDGWRDNARRYGAAHPEEADLALVRELAHQRTANHLRAVLAALTPDTSGETP